MLFRPRVLVSGIAPNSEPNNLKSILDRLYGARRGSSSSMEPTSAPDVVVQDLATPPPSVTGTTFPSLYTAVATQPPTSLSSLLRSISPQISNRPSASALYDGNRLWPSIGILPPPSLAISDHSEENITQGLLDPQPPWRLERARVDSSVSLRGHEIIQRRSEGWRVTGGNGAGRAQRWDVTITR